MYKKRRFIILRRPIAGADLSTLLGKITLDYTSPLDNSVPEDPTPYTRGCLLGDTTETAAEIWGSAADGTLLKAALKPFVEVTYGTDSEKIYTLDSALIRTHGIESHTRVFERIWQKHKDAIDELIDNATSRLRVIPDKIYMVTGYKAVFDATRTEATTTSKDFSVSGKVPVPTSGAVPPGTRIEGSWQRTRDSGEGIQSTLVGETAVAVEYRTYKRSRILAFLRKKAIGTFVDAGVKLHDPSIAMGAERNAEEEEEDESDDEFMLEVDGSDAHCYSLEEGMFDQFWVPQDNGS